MSTANAWCAASATGESAGRDARAAALLAYLPDRLRERLLARITR